MHLVCYDLGLYGLEVGLWKETSGNKHLVHKQRLEYLVA